MTLRQQQITKFYITCLLAIFGLLGYIATDGTFIKALVIYVCFWLVTKIAKVGYHRWLSHNQISPGPFGKCILLYTMVASALVKPIHYVIGHRIHHKYPDSNLDPHPPIRGFFTTLIGDFQDSQDITVSLKDVLRKREVVFVNQYFYQLYLLNLIIWLMIDYQVVLLSFAFLNLRFMINVAIFNYVTHGGKKGQTAMNLPIWGLYFVGTPGEHLHKNHHDYPSRANFGTVSPWNFDVTYHILKRLTKVND